MQNFVLNMKTEGQEDYYDRDHAKCTEAQWLQMFSVTVVSISLASKFSLPTLKQKNASFNPTGIFFDKKSLKLLLS